MYNSTPNKTTGKTPSDLFLRRQFRDDRVYRKNLTKANKIAPNFNGTPHVVTRKIGGDVVVRDDVTEKEYRRNVVHLKKVEGEWKVHNNEINNGTGNSKE
nr:unnamed protein product [Callosobruchus chinensis]